MKWFRYINPLSVFSLFSLLATIYFVAIDGLLVEMPAALFILCVITIPTLLANYCFNKGIPNYKVRLLLQLTTVGAYLLWLNYYG